MLTGCAIALGVFLGVYAVVALVGCFLLAVSGMIVFPILTKESTKKIEAQRAAAVALQDAKRRQLLQVLEPVAYSTDSKSRRPRRPSFALTVERAKRAVGCLPFAK